MNEDITYCVANCKHRDDCERNPNKIKLFTKYHSFADLSESCERYEKWEEKENV